RSQFILKEISNKNLSLVGSSTIDYSSEWSKLKEAVDAVYQSTKEYWTIARFKRRCIGGLLELIELERGGDAVDRQLLRTLLRMLFDLGQYRTVFEPEFLAATERLYRIEGQQRLAALENRGGHSQLCGRVQVAHQAGGCSIVQNPSCDPEKDRAMVQQLLDFKDKVDEIQANCFDSNEKFQHAIVHSFEAMRNWSALLDKIMVLFRFRAASDAEKSMLSKLKQECGAGYTNKLEGMFKDIELSHDINSAFRQHLAQQPQPPSIDMSVNPGEVRLPPEMISLQELFRRFYLGKHTGRRLLFQHSLGCCNLKAQFSGGQRKELLVSEFQTLVLLLFNDSDSLTLIEIADRTGIEESELKRTAAEPVCPRSSRGADQRTPLAKMYCPLTRSIQRASSAHKLINR
uniref:CULLIN_2 domain-containing protein n=1 Tax=Macrostomum lignano TaxID=282301 RepID=A0A1I8JQC9_9PLAT